MEIGTKVRVLNDEYKSYGIFEGDIGVLALDYSADADYNIFRFSPSLTLGLRTRDYEVVGEESGPKQGIKHDAGKPDLSMVSYELMEEVAKVRMFGAKKYSRNNWKKGFKITRSCAAALRHIFLFLSGETNDQESGLLHLAHAVCCLEHAIYDMKHHPENDDRGDE